MRRSKVGGVTSPHNESIASLQRGVMKDSGHNHSSKEHSEHEGSETSSQLHFKFRHKEMQKSATTINQASAEKLMSAIDGRLQEDIVRSLSRLVKSKIACKNLDLYIKEPQVDDSPFPLVREDTRSPPMPQLDTQVTVVPGLTRKPTRRMTMQSREEEDAAAKVRSPDIGSPSRRRLMIYDRTNKKFMTENDAQGEDNVDDRDDSDQGQNREKEDKKVFASPSRSNKIPSNDSGDGSSPEIRRAFVQPGGNRVLRKSTTVIVAPREDNPNSSSDAKQNLKQISEEGKDEEPARIPKQSKTTIAKSSENIRRRRTDNLVNSNILGGDYDSSPTRTIQSGTLGVAEDSKRHRRLPSAGSGQVIKSAVLYGDEANAFGEYLLNVSPTMRSDHPYKEHDFRIHELEGEYKARLLTLQKVISSLRRKRLRAFFSIILRNKMILQERVREKLDSILQSPLQPRRSVKDGYERLEITKETTTHKQSYSAMDTSDNKNIESKKFVTICRTMIGAQNKYNSLRLRALHILTKHTDLLLAEEERKHHLQKELSTIVIKSQMRDSKHFLHKFYTQTKLKSTEIRDNDKKTALKHRHLEKVAAVVQRATQVSKMNALMQIASKAQRYYNPSKAYLRMAGLSLWTDRKNTVIRVLNRVAKNKTTILTPLQTITRILGACTFRQLSIGWRSILTEDLRFELEEELKKRLRFKMLKTGAMRRMILSGIMKNVTVAISRMRDNARLHKIMELKKNIVHIRKSKILGILVSNQVSKISFALNSLLKLFSSSVLADGPKVLSLYKTKILCGKLFSANKQKLVTSLLILVRNSLGEERLRYLKSTLSRLRTIPRSQLSAGFSQLKLLSEGTFMVLSRRSLCITHGMSLLPGFFRSNLVLGFRMIFERSYGVQKTKQASLKRLEFAQGLKLAESLRRLESNAGVKASDEQRWMEKKHRALKAVLTQTHWRLMVYILAKLKNSAVQLRTQERDREELSHRRTEGVLKIKGFYEAMERRAFSEFIISGERMNSAHWKQKYTQFSKLKVLARIYSYYRSIQLQALNKMIIRAIGADNQDKLNRLARKRVLSNIVMASSSKLQQCFSVLLLNNSLLVVQKQGLHWLEASVSKLARPAVRSAFDLMKNKPTVVNEANEKLLVLANIMERKVEYRPFSKLRNYSMVYDASTKLGKCSQRLISRIVFRNILIAGNRRAKEREQRGFRRTMGIVIMIDKYDKLKRTRVVDAFWRTCCTGLDTKLLKAVQTSGNLKRIFKAHVLYRMNSNQSMRKAMALRKLITFNMVTVALSKAKSLGGLAAPVNRLLASAFTLLRMYRKAKEVSTTSTLTEVVDTASKEIVTDPIPEPPKPVMGDQSVMACVSTSEFGTSNVPHTVGVSAYTVSPQYANISTETTPRLTKTSEVQTTKVETVSLDTQTAQIVVFSQNVTKVAKETSSFSEAYNFQPEVKSIELQVSVATQDQYTQSEALVLTVSSHPGVEIQRKFPLVEALAFVGLAEPMQKKSDQVTETEPLPKPPAPPVVLSKGTDPEPEVEQSSVVPEEHLEVDTSQQKSPIVVLPQIKTLVLPISPPVQMDQEVEEFEVRSCEERHDSSEFSALGSFRTAEHKKTLRAYRNANEKDPYGFKVGISKPKALMTDRGINRTDTKKLFESRDCSRDSSVHPVLPKNRFISDSSETVSKFPKKDIDFRESSDNKQGAERSTMEYSLASKNYRMQGLRSPGGELSIGLYERFNTQEEERRDSREGLLMLAMIFSTKGAGRVNAINVDFKRDAFQTIKNSALTARKNQAARGVFEFDSRTESIHNNGTTSGVSNAKLALPLLACLHRLSRPSVSAGFQAVKHFSHISKIVVIAYQLFALEENLKEEIEQRAKDALTLIQQEEESINRNRFLLDWANSVVPPSTEN